MRKIVILLLIVCCSCSQNVSTPKGIIKVKEKKTSTPYVFVIVTSFMLGFVITDEYFLEKK